MLKPEMIPEVVVEAAVSTWLNSDGSVRQDITETIAAALNAWPGVIDNGHWLLFPHTKLPLTQENSDE